VFDILTPEHEWVEYLRFAFNLSVEHTVPSLYVGPFDIEKIKALAAGKSTLDNKTIREGVVIKPTKERQVPGLGRLKLKLISMEYLEKGN
jgi:hypothetical protein